MLLVSFRRITIIALLALLVGCSGSRQYQMAIDAMRSEMLAVEDRYYNLEHEYRIQQAELERYREQYGDSEEEDDTLPQSFEDGDFRFREDFNPGQGSYDSPDSILAEGSSDRRGNPVRSGPGRGSDVARRQSTPRRGPGNLSDPVVTLPSNSMSADEFMKLLEGETGSDSVDEGDSQELPLNGNRESSELANSDRVPAREISGQPGPSRREGAGQSGNESLAPGSRVERAHEHPVQIAKAEPTHLVINPLLTRGRDLDGADGDDGFAVVVETRNADDLFVPAVGELIVSVLDPEEEGEAQRVGIWHYSPADVAKHLKDVPGQGRGINLLIDFPGDPPRHRTLKVFVRFIDESGRRLESSTNLNIAIPGDGQTGWSIRTTPRLRGNGTEQRSGVPTEIPQVARDPRNGSSYRGLPATINPNPSTTSSSGSRPSNANSQRPQWSPNR